MTVIFLNLKWKNDSESVKSIAMGLVFLQLAKSWRAANYNVIHHDDDL